MGNFVQENLFSEMLRRNYSICIKILEFMLYIYLYVQAWLLNMYNGSTIKCIVYVHTARYYNVSNF